MPKTLATSCVLVVFLVHSVVIVADNDPYGLGEDFDMHEGGDALALASEVAPLTWPKNASEAEMLQGSEWLELALARPEERDSAVAANLTDAIRLLQEQIDEYGSPTSKYALALLVSTQKPRDSFDEQTNAMTSTDLLSSAASAGVIEALAALGYRHLRGYGKLQGSCSAASSYYHQAATHIVTTKEASGETHEREMPILLRDDWTGAGITHAALKDRWEAEAADFDLFEADAGNADAQRTVGFRALTGKGMEKDLETAHQHLLAAHEQGDGQASFNLGYMYYEGYGAEQNYTEALRLFLISAEQGCTQGYNAIAVIYLHGLGTPENTTKAIEYLELAAEHSDPDGTFNLAQLTLYGLSGVSQNFTKAKELAHAADGLGCWKAKYLLGQIYLFGMGVPVNCEQGVDILKSFVDHWGPAGTIIEEAEKAWGQGHSNLALRLYWEAAELGSSDAQNNAAFMAEQLPSEQLVLEHTATEISQKYIDAAAAQNSSSALVTLGDRHYYGISPFERNVSAAAECYLRATRGYPSPQAFFNVGYMYQFGDGLPQDFKQAAHYYKRAINNAYTNIALSFPAHILSALLPLHKLWVSWVDAPTTTAATATVVHDET